MKTLQFKFSQIAMFLILLSPCVYAQSITGGDSYVSKNVGHSLSLNVSGYTPSNISWVANNTNVSFTSPNSIATNVTAGANVCRFDVTVNWKDNNNGSHQLITKMEVLPEIIATEAEIYPVEPDNVALHPSGCTASHCTAEW